MLTTFCRFYDLVARYFTITADPDKSGQWPSEPRPEVACLPQWLLDDLIYFYEWLAAHAVDILGDSAHHQNLLSFLTLLLSCDKYLHNPHLRGNLLCFFSFVFFFFFFFFFLLLLLSNKHISKQSDNHPH